MRMVLLMLIGSLAAGCANSHWQVIATPSEPILLETGSGKTWSRAYYMRPGEGVYTPYWKEMDRGQATTRPVGGQ